jgi:hypothetical protein
MSIYRYNFNEIQNRDIKKYLQSKFNFEKWEDSIAEDAIFSHFSNFNKISYGFPISKNFFIILKKILKKNLQEYELPYLFFDKKNEKEILYKNIDFFEESMYYLRNSEGKREIYNYKLSSIESVRKIIMNKLKDYNDDSQFLLEKSNKNVLLFQGNSFELRTYVLVVKIEKKIYTFIYPLLIFHFGVENINMIDLLKFLDVEYENGSKIDSFHPIMNDIYTLVQKTANIIANVVKLTNYIYKIENTKKYKKLDKSQMQYHLYALDITLNEDKKPFLVDIIEDPFYSPSKEDLKIIKEKNKIFNDIIENFIIPFSKYSNISFDSSDFILLKNTNQYFDYKLLICKKLNDDFINKDFLSKDGENFLIKILNDPIIEFKTDNSAFLKNIKLKNGCDDNIEKLIINSEKNSECMFETEKIDDVNIDQKIEDLITKERKEKIIGIASATIPIFLATYLAKKTYQALIKKN